jgi:uncharacterized protein YndB with AHSA1/START domain
MGTSTKKVISVHTIIHASVDKVWRYFTTPEYITKWNFASDDWHSPGATNDLLVGGKFNYRMEAKDGSFRFDFYGTYDTVIENELIEYTLGDERKVKVIFYPMDNRTEVVENFEAENENSVELQHNGWQAILDNLKKLVESTN